LADPATHRTVEAVWRIESARLIAGLARATGDVGLAEDLAQDALVAALEQWPESGVPDNPGAWLTAVARRRYVDGVRRQVSLERKVAEIGRELTEAQTPMDEIEFDEHVEDDVLRLIFTACHPVLSRDARVALTLKLVGGLSTEQIAHAFLVATPTMAARITRAKKALSDGGVPFEVPVGTELAARLASVLEVIYLIFNEGYAATAGDALTRAELYEEAMRLGRMLAALAPGEPEVHGLVALMEIQASRIPARTGRDGRLVPLPDQDRGRWNRLLITHGLAALATARSISGSSFANASGCQSFLTSPNGSVSVSESITTKHSISASHSGRSTYQRRSEIRRPPSMNDKLPSSMARATSMTCRRALLTCGSPLIPPPRAPGRRVDRLAAAIRGAAGERRAGRPRRRIPRPG